MFLIIKRRHFRVCLGPGARNFRRHNLTFNSLKFEIGGGLIWRIFLDKTGSKDGGGSSKKGRKKGPASENSLEEMKQQIESERKRLKVILSLFISIFLFKWRIFLKFQGYNTFSSLLFMPIFRLLKATLVEL
jgi:hypothetical protein